MQMHSLAVMRFALAAVLALFCALGCDSGSVSDWREAADKGDTEAQYNLAVAYDKGEGVDMDRAQAAKWYQKAAEKGHAQAQLNLGLGKGVRSIFLTFKIFL